MSVKSISITLITGQEEMSINIYVDIGGIDVLGYAGAGIIVAQTFPQMLVQFKDHIHFDERTLDYAKGFGMIMNVVGGTLFVTYGALTNNYVIYGPFAAYVAANLLGLIMKIVFWIRGRREQRLY